MSDIGNSTTLVTLSTSGGTQTIIGDINAYSIVGIATIAGTYGAYQPIGAAIVGFNATTFNIVNDGNVQSDGTAALDGGIVLSDSASLANNGSIAGGSGAILFGYANQVTNAGLLDGRVGFGLYIQRYGVVSNSGAILGAAVGVAADRSIYLSNTGTIAGADGVLALDEPDILNAGTILGSLGDGLAAQSGEAVNLAGGTISGAAIGVYLSAIDPYYASGLAENDGLIQGGAAGVALLGGGYVANGGSIEGGVFGVYAQSSFTSPAAQIDNQSAARITGARYGVAIAGAATIYNAGYLEGGAGVTDRNEATPFGGYGASNTGILLGEGLVTNTGTVNGGGTGIFLKNFANLYNRGLVEAANIGVYATGYGSVQNTGIISAQNEGMYVSGPKHVYNQGVIGGNAAGLQATGRDFIENQTGGLIFGHDGVILTGNEALLINDGQVTGYGGDALVVGAQAFGVNDQSGLVVSRASGAAAVLLEAGGAFSNYGTVLGAGDGIQVEAGGSVRVISGTIIGGNGTAVAFAPGFANELAISPDATFIGAVIVNGILGLDAGASQVGTLDLKPFTDVTGIEVQEGVWILPQTFGSGTLVTNSYGTITAAAKRRPALTAATVYNYGVITGSSAGIVASTYVYNKHQVDAAGQTGTGIRLTAPGTVVNAVRGTIKAHTGIALPAGGAVYNYGDIKGGISAGAATYLYNGARAKIAGAGAVSLSGASYLYNLGLIDPAAGVTLTGAGSLVNFGTITGNVDIEGGTLFNGGTILAAATATTIAAAAIYGRGEIVLGTHALTIDGAAAPGQTIAFTAPGETLDLAGTTGFTEILQHFTTTDTIDLSSIPLVSIVSTAFAHGILTLTETTGSLTLTFASPTTLSGETVSLFADGAGTGITLSQAAAMTFITPTSTPTAAITLPAYAPTPATLPPASAYIATAAATGVIAHDLFKPTPTSFLAVTL